MPVADRVAQTPRLTPALTPRGVAREQRRGAGLDSTATRTRRPRAVGILSATRAYRPCVLSWASGGPTDALIEQMRRAALDLDRSSLVITLDARTQAWLVAEDSPASPSRARLREAVQSLIEAVRVARPEAEIRAVVGDRIPSGERLPVVAARLRSLARYARERGGDEVAWARRYSLAGLLETLDGRQASAFVEGQLANLCAYDHEHGTNLLRVVELALDHGDRNTAARAAFMHRNTFRRQLAKALELIDVDLACPEERLALHVALKLRGLRE